MKILFLPNWKVKKYVTPPADLQSPDYYTDSKHYWFFKYMDNVDVDIVDISSIKFIENFEKNKFRFYAFQTLRALFKISKYDLVISHGMQSGIVLAVFRKIFKWPRSPHIVFDIGSFNSAKEYGLAHKLMQFASKSIDGVIYHTSLQRNYYKQHYPWLLSKAKFIPFGTDFYFFKSDTSFDIDRKPYILCVGYGKRDWNTLIKAFSQIDTNVELLLIGKADLVISASNIRMQSYIPIKNLIALIQHSLFCVLPLQWFNYSFGQMTLLQQMALRKTVVVAKVPSMEDYVSDGISALFYEPENINDLKNKIELCLTNTALVETIGKQAALSVCNQFNEVRMAKDVELFIKEKR
jgi:glycosyltransferase involved in cell wall biosynthesis